MAVGETAKLIASLELQDKFSKTADNATRKLGGLEGTATRAGRQIGIAGHAMGTALGIGLARAVSSGVSLLTSQITQGVESLHELESVTVATNTVIESTKGIAGQTASGVRDLAEEYENLNATVDDKVIQSGANLLLTFTNIRDKAFEPALEAALNMNEAMGGGPEGLQSTIIQVGKALNDPIKGVTALRRVGVQLSEQQEKQIKTLVEQNDLYGAQQVIIDELGTQFGGRFAAAGDTAIGKQAALRDSIEDLQKALAGPLIPAIDKVRDKITDLFRSDRAQAAAGRLGEAIAGIFTDENLETAVDAIETGLDKLQTFDFNKIGDGVNKVFGFLGEVPWGTIADGMRITGAAAKVVVDAFLSLPKEVQGIVIAGLAVNKLSGGVAGSLAKGLGGIAIDVFKGRGSTPANPLFVADIGGGGGGGGVPGVGGRAGGGIRGAINGGGLVGGLATGTALASIPLAGIAAVEVVNFSNMRTEAMGGLQTTLDEMPRQTGAEIDASIARIEGVIAEERPLLDGILFNTNVKPQLDAELQELRRMKAEASANARLVADRHKAAVAAGTFSQINEFRRGSNERRNEANQLASKTAAVAARVAEARNVTQTGFTSMGGRLDTANSRLSTIASKNVSPIVKVNVTSNVTISEVQRKIISQQIAIGRGFLEGTG